MTYNELLHWARVELSVLYTAEEVRMLLRYWADDCDANLYTKLLSDPSLALDDPHQNSARSYVQALKSGKPYQYVLGTSWFRGLAFEVAEGVLIPRPETEELVEWICATYPIDSSLTILDLGTGSGCVAISLAQHFRSAKIHAIDLSTSAVACAQRNTAKHQVRVGVERADLFEYNANCSYDVIVSNPPYVRRSEKKDMEAKVLDHEPHEALFVSDNNPLVYYRHIVDWSFNALNENGVLFLEINENFGAEVQFLCRQRYAHVELRNDFRGKPRMIQAKKRDL
jgi:release factor glutamine methyltransferase